MTEEVKLRTEALRWAHFRDDCNDEYYTCPVQDKCSNYNSVLCDLRTAADLIESLSAELEQVKKERDAAVEQMSEYCEFCVRYGWKVDELCYNCKMHVLPFDDDEGERENYWQWRGVKMGEDVQHD